MVKYFLVILLLIVILGSYSFSQGDLPPPLPNPNNTQNSTNSSQNLSCLPEFQQTKVNIPTKVSAAGGSRSYLWSAIGGEPSSGNGSSISPIYQTEGLKRVTVSSSGQSKVCFINVTASLSNYSINYSNQQNSTPINQNSTQIPPLPGTSNTQTTQSNNLYDIFDKLDALKLKMNEFLAKSKSIESFYRKKGRISEANRYREVISIFTSVSLNIDETKSYILSNKNSAELVSQSVKKLTSYTRNSLEKARQLIKPQFGQDCMITGCNNEICSNEQATSACEYREEYSCYKTANCEKQTNGNCGWTITSQLEACLAESTKQTIVTIEEGHTKEIIIDGLEHYISVNVIIDNNKALIDFDGYAVSMETEQTVKIGGIIVRLDSITLSLQSRNARITVSSDI